MRVPKDGERLGMGLSQYYILRMRSIPEKLERGLAAAERILRLRLKMTHRQGGRVRASAWFVVSDAKLR